MMSVKLWWFLNNVLFPYLINEAILELMVIGEHYDYKIKVENKI